MSILGANNRIFKAGNFVFGSKTAFSFQTLGVRFPNRGLAASNPSRFILNFNASCTVNINFGDGVTIAFPTKISGSFHQVALTYDNVSLVSPLNSLTDYAAYVYSSGNSTTIRNISVVIAESDRNKFVGFSFQSIQLLTQVFQLDFLQFPNFTNLHFGNVNNSLISIDDSFLTLPNFTTYSVFGAYMASSHNYGAIPTNVLAKSTITSLNFGDDGFAAKTFAQNRMDQIQPSFPNLTTIIINQIKLTDVMGLPSNFVNIPNLLTLTITGSLFTSIPNVGAYPNLSTLNLSYNNSLTSWGNLSGLGNKLTLLLVTGCDNLTATLPSYFSNLNKLRTFSWLACGFGQSGKIDTFITNFYNHIVANATITGASTLDFRGMRISIQAENGANGVIPAGIYQQPVGYVAGSSNGTPASSLERLWVLVNQYLHTITYRTV